MERTKLNPAQQAVLKEHAAELERLTSALIIERAGDTGLRAVVEAIELAHQHSLPLWCDDAVFRRTARGQGVPTFSLLDLLTALAERSSSVNSTAMLRQLASHNAADLLLTSDCIVAVAELRDWEIGPAHVALSRPGWWGSQTDWTPGEKIAAVAAAQSATALVDLTKAALAGAVAEVGMARGTQRYQQLVVATLIACQGVGVAPPPNMLALLAEHAVAGLPPKPGFVLASLIQELERRSVPDSLSISHELFPDMRLE